MSQIEIRSRSNSWNFEPGQLLQADVQWQLTEPATTIEISLLWRTTGKAASDSATVATVQIDRPEATGSHPFSFPLPPGPYSFAGNLLSLEWSIEVTVHPQTIATSQAIVIAPARTRISLLEGAVSSITGAVMLPQEPILPPEPQPAHPPAPGPAA